jgi:hypothetical protein
MQGTIGDDMHEPHTGFRQPAQGVAGAAAVLAFALVFLIMAGTYLADAQSTHDEACATAEPPACDDARTDRNVAMLVTVGVATAAAVGASVAARRVVATRTARVT